MQPDEQIRVNKLRGGGERRIATAFLFPPIQPCPREAGVTSRAKYGIYRCRTTDISATQELDSTVCFQLLNIYPNQTNTFVPFLFTLRTFSSSEDFSSTLCFQAFSLSVIYVVSFSRTGAHYKNKGEWGFVFFSHIQFLLEDQRKGARVNRSRRRYKEGIRENKGPSPNPNKSKALVNGKRNFHIKAMNLILQELVDRIEVRHYLPFNLMEHQVVNVEAGQTCILMHKVNIRLQ